MILRPRPIVFALAGLLLSLRAAPARAEDEVVEQALIPDRVWSAARLRTALDPTDPDTVWVGHIQDPTWTAGGTMTAGGYGPYRVGRGPNRPRRAGVPTTLGGDGTWDFDRFQGPASPGGAETDSLQGWWPIARAYQSGATTFPDWRRPFFGLDYGNQVNYVINQGSPKRTFGVTGLWHRDRGDQATGSPDTIPGTNVRPVLWSPTELGGPDSHASAWMGMRSHGDLTHRDAIGLGGTGNPFNASLLQYQGNNGFNATGSVALNGTDHNFPGYGSQMDQMLYRDIALGEADGLTISFNFSTAMSTAKNATPGVQVGWFDKDPISPAATGVDPFMAPTNDGNFISAAGAGAGAPCDSFMVYIGVPVDDSNVQFSAPLVVGGNPITTVYDPRRRWFSEVLRIDGPCLPGSPCGILGKELMSVAGVQGPTSVSIDVLALYHEVLQAIKDADGTVGDGGVVRLVFRVKTNRGFDDENRGNPAATFDSGTRGAAIVDNVVVNGWPAAEGDFEAEDAINNDPAVSAFDAWKSTGKPPAVYWHPHTVAPGGGLPFNDPCGGLDNPNRACNLYGKIVTPGDHDDLERNGGPFGTNLMDRQKWLVSPTINLASSGNGPGAYNAMGIDDEVARTTFDYALYSSLYNAALVNAPTATGIFVSVGAQSYPARQANGNICWGEARHTASIFFQGSRTCLETFHTLSTGSIGFKANGLIRTTNADNRPDSLRVYLQIMTRCYTGTAIPEAECAPTSGDQVGVYFDNISLALIDSPAPVAMSIPIWGLINDAFPANPDATLIPAGFDTTAAQIRIGRNVAGLTNTVTRPSVAGDSMVVTAPGGAQRLDLVFRVLPGPGNHVTIGSKASGVARRPDAVPRVAATPGDGSFFGEIMAQPGEFASASSHVGQGPGGSDWSQHIWNSARMDTVELNLFPTASNAGVVGLTPGVWRSTYHESDPKFATLGAVKNICVMPNPAGPANSTNIACDGTGWGAYGAGSGWNGMTTTREHTKIIPDGLLTPGSHVQYFFRKSAVASPAVFTTGPDTSFIFQPAEGNTDGHRWQQFGVLPDRWKDGAWSVEDRSAPAPACMLYVDWCDRRGDERTWVGIADSIGATSPERRGAHNGWRARGDQDITVAVATDTSIAVYPHGGQPGTIWDMFGVKGAENTTTTGSLGSRLATSATGLMAGKDTRGGPTGAMLRHYYRILFALTGDLGAGNIGPYPDKGDNDIALLQDFATGVAGTPRPRAVWFQGDAFVEGQVTGGAMGHPTFTTTFFGAQLASGDYRGYAQNTTDNLDLTPFPPTVTDGSLYGVNNNCRTANDVLSLAGGVGAVVAARYADSPVGPNPKIASIYAPSSLPAATHPMITLVNGWRISSLGSWKTLTSQGTIGYHHQVFTNLFAALNCALAPGGPVAVGETPNPAPASFLTLRSANPMGDPGATIAFGLTRREPVELRVYDVAGRVVRTLARREFAAGEHQVVWDGSDDAGRRVPRGVYFYQLRTPSFVSQKKLAVLGR